jgi:hypothetical protein
MCNNNRRIEFALFRSWCLILYGSADPVQHSDDELTQFSSSSSSPPYNNNTIYRIKSQNYKNKQQQSQKITTASTQSTVPSTSSRKNGKQKNKNGKNNQRLLSSTTTTTSRPLSYSTVMLNGLQRVRVENLIRLNRLSHQQRHRSHVHDQLRSFQIRRVITISNHPRNSIRNIRIFMRNLPAKHRSK